ncbi:sigma 54 modulation/S30EA ribosomal C-terminal domain-containing protein [Nocardia sp. NPDC005366]|uniref:sigma 54 modulation/S30EA ribosomal C-terminal domain-containing protein n=1 Tax=Nocardia sp. NPDC005366 TaxID=3156878 RepID=UPI0033A2FA27
MGSRSNPWDLEVGLSSVELSEMRPIGTGMHCELVTRGAIGDREVERTLRSVGRVARHHGIDATARVRLTAAPCVDGPVLAQVNVRFREGPVRVQVGGPSGFIATFVAERLDRQIARIAAGDAMRIWPDPARPALASITEPRPIVRRKYYELLRGDPMTAASAMDAMDYDAYLYTDAETGEDATVYWAGPTGVRLARQHRVDPPRSNPLPLSMNPHPAPLLTDTEAADRLCRYGLPFVFFTDPGDKRGRLLYRRYDGDLALVAPAATERGDGS